jgi:hypothetical protein
MWISPGFFNPSRLSPLTHKGINNGTGGLLHVFEGKAGSQHIHDTTAAYIYLINIVIVI